MRNSEPPPTSDVTANAPVQPPPAKAVTPSHAEAIRSPSPSRRPAEVAPPPPKRLSAPAAAHKPTQVAKPVAKAVAKPPAKAPGKPPTKPPAYDPNALFLKKP